MRTLRGRASIQETAKNKEGTKEKKPKKLLDDDDIGADGDETTDDEGGIDTPPPPNDEEDDDSKGDEKSETEDTMKEKSKDNSRAKINSEEHGSNSRSKNREQAINSKRANTDSSDFEGKNHNIDSMPQNIVSINEPVEKAPRNTRPKRKSTDEMEHQEADDEFEVEQVVDMETKQRWKCPVRFRVRWVGYGEKDDTWLPATELNCDDLVNEFLEISGRKPEYERAMEAKKTVTEGYQNGRQSARNISKISYSELEEDEDEILPSGTKSRSHRIRVGGASSISSKQKNKKSKSHPKKMKRSNNIEEEYEVESIAGMREINGYPEYKIRWKGFSSRSDSWLKENELNCPTMLKKFKDTLKKLEEQKDWQVEKIVDMRDKKGKKEFLIGWKGFDSKCNTWEPEENLQGCKDLLLAFLAKEKKDKEKLLKSKRETRDRDERSRPERYVENFSEGTRARSKRSRLNVSYTEEDE